MKGAVIIQVLLILLILCILDTRFVMSRMRVRHAEGEKFCLQKYKECLRAKNKSAKTCNEVLNKDFGCYFRYMLGWAKKAHFPEESQASSSSKKQLASRKILGGKVVMITRTQRAGKTGTGVSPSKPKSSSSKNKKCVPSKNMLSRP